MELEDLRLAVYRGFAATGAPPSLDALSARLSWSTAEVVDGLWALARDRHLVLAEADGPTDPDPDDPADPSGGRAPRVVMAHPFSAVPLGFAVMRPATLWWGGCAWDSFALPHLLDDAQEVLVSTRCPACGRPHAWNVTRSGPPEGGQVVHFLVPAAQMWNDVVHTCAHQRLFCSPACVEAWLRATGYQRGYVMDLATLWRLAAHWYDGRLERGYTRRDPGASADYLRSVGLSGPFWGL